MTCKCSAKDFENGNIPAFTGTSAFMHIFPINRNRLLELCNHPKAPVIKNGKKFVIKTADMIRFIEEQSVGA
ncbi:MAG: helix-turn-helix domain-containing protein [Hungateiclostridium thermocellum]|jgi:hypothetical protein|nr:helix-turn-helix domain-containing protein [Acetivibrio thermocellus]